MTRSVQKISQIDFVAMYEPVFPEGGAEDFVIKVRSFSSNKRPTQIMCHQAARMVWIADQFADKILLAVARAYENARPFPTLKD